MELMCPLCGEAIPVKDDTAFACPKCGGVVRREPHGRAFILSPAVQPASAEEEHALQLVEQARSAQDPVRKHDLLTQAEALAPALLPVQTELLHLGKLWQRGRSGLDYALIKCYLLHVFECPEDYAPQLRETVLRELTADPQLEKCLALAPLPETFLRDYCLRLCREYISIFLMGDSRHRRMLMGIPMMRAEKALAGVSAAMLRRMAEAALPAPYDALLPECFHEAFRLEVGDDTWLNQAMKEQKA